jgi:hypothetical protein
MKAKRFIFPIVALLIVFSAVGSTWSVAFAREPNDSANFFLTYLEEADVFLGKGGVYTPASGFTAVAVINRWEPYGIYHQGLKFVDRWIEYRIYNYDTAEPFEILLGMNYVYFNLTDIQRKLWDAGRLSIYYYNENTLQWDPCWTYLVPNENIPYGRATCIMPGFGYYGLAKSNN